MAFTVGVGVAVAQVVSTLATISVSPPHQVRGHGLFAQNFCYFDVRMMFCHQDRIRAELQQLFEALMRHDQLTVRWAGCR